MRPSSKPTISSPTLLQLLTSGLVQGGRLRCCSKLRQPLGVKLTWRSSRLRSGSLLSLELVDGTRPHPCHARHLANAETFGEFVPGACDLLGLRPGWPRRLRTTPALVVKCPSCSRAWAHRDGAFAM